MTAKRFVNKGKHIFQYGEWWCSANGEHCADVIATAMNELVEENEQLKTVINRYEKYSNKKNDELNFRQLDILKLKEENEELKETIDELRTIDKEKDIEVEHINNIYKEFGFKGLIDYAKNKLYNFGAVREVEEGLWLLATGGWSDNEFWLDCLSHWNFMYAKGHYRATTSGGGYYYSEKPYADITVVLNNIKCDCDD